MRSKSRALYDSRKKSARIAVDRWADQNDAGYQAPGYLQSTSLAGDFAEEILILPGNFLPRVFFSNALRPAQSKRIDKAGVRFHFLNQTRQSPCVSRPEKT